MANTNTKKCKIPPILEIVIYFGRKISQTKCSCRTFLDGYIHKREFITMKIWQNRLYADKSTIWHIFAAPVK